MVVNWELKEVNKRLVLGKIPDRSSLRSCDLSLEAFIKRRSNSSGPFLAPPAAALEKEGDCARTPRSPARGLRPPAPPVWVTHLVTPPVYVHRRPASEL